MSESDRPPASASEPPEPRLKRTALELFAVSCLVLFQELALIRWLPGQVRVLAYFPNLVLISAFLGLGVGALVSAGRSLRWLWPVSLLVLVVTAGLLSGIAFTQETVSEFLWLLYFDLPQDAPTVHGVRAPILLLFVLSAITFIPLGQIVARRLQAFRRRSRALWGYAWDLGGSLLGVVGFALFSFLRTPPAVWFGGILLLGSMIFFSARRDRWGRWVFLASAPLLMFGVMATERAELYSPYYALRFVEYSHGMGVTTNGSLHQVAQAVGRDFPPVSEAHEALIQGYHLPYRLLNRPPGRVLVLGAGTGNDVSVALDEGATRVDAVEIDPVILEGGRFMHPDRPYESPRVHAVNTDARSFLRGTEERWDLIVFGTLDSMTRLSALANVRLDNFVYTQESIEAARDALTEDGGLMLYFMVPGGYIDLRLRDLLWEAFGEPPLVFGGDYRMFNHVYLAGPAFAEVAPEIRQEIAAAGRPEVETPTDDWPYLYLASRQITPFYLSLMGAILVVAVVGVGAASGPMRRSLLSGKGFDGEMLLYGMAFLLLETKLVTEMSLAWGATWLTSAVVFGSILAMVLASTVATELQPLRWRWAALGLAASLLLTYWIPLEALAVSGQSAGGLGLRLLVSCLYAGTPLFFAAVCFAHRFRVRDSVDLAFGWNLLGAVLGGLLELTSMALGLRSLTLIALAAYLAAFWIRERGRESEIPAEGSPRAGLGPA